MPRTKWLGAVAVVIGIVVITLFGRRLAGYIPPFVQWVASLGPAGPIAFMAGYVLATIAFVPGSLLTMAGGALFGLSRGTIFVFIAATMGATAAFLISRYFARRAVERRLADWPQFKAIDAAVAREGRKIVFLLRLSPVFPFNLLNYALGLTRVRLRDYVIACIGMLPGTLLWVYYGHLLGSVADSVSGSSVPRGTGYWLVTGLGLIATLVVTIIIARMAKRALGPVVEDGAA